MIRTVAHFVESPVFGGTEKAVLTLLAGLDRTCWRPVLFHRPEPGLKPLLDQAGALDVPTREVPWLRGMHAGRQLLEIVRALRAERVSVFHAHLHWPLACKGGILGATLARVPAIVATAHLFVPLDWSRMIHFQQRVTATRVHRYIAVSNGVARQLRQVFDVPASKISVVHNAVPAGAAGGRPDQALRTAWAGSTGRRVVLTAARLAPQKGQRYLLEAAALLPDVHFVLAGDGPDKDQLCAQANELHLSDRVTFLGHRTDVPDLLANCDVFVLPSLFEGLPLTVLEAMSACKPVVATAVEGTDEVVTDGENGLLVPPRDPEALAHAIRTLLDNPALARRLALAGKARVRSEFSAAVMARRVSDVYQQVLERAGSR